MMDRVLGRSAAHRLTVSRGARDSMLVQHLSFWGRYVDARPESLAVVFLAVPHEVFSFVLYNLARLTSIPVLVVTPEKSALLEHDRISQQRPKDRQSSINTSVFFVAESLSDIGRWQLASNLAQSGPRSEFIRPSTFFYGSSSYQTPGDRAHGAIRPRKYSARRLDPVRVLHRSRSEIQRVMWQWHTTSKSRPQHSRNLLFPLAYQPEESTSPRAGEFVDQELAVDAIRTALPPTWTLRVREHPHQFQRHRPRASGYYKHFYRRSGVELVPLTESPLESLRSADAVAAVGGSLSIAAWKAAKPLLLLGHTLLKVAPGVRHVSEAEMIQPRLQELLAAPQTEFTQASRVLFDQWTVARAFSGDPGLGSTFRDHHPEITSHNLSRLLINWLKELQRQPTQRGESLRSRPR